MIVLANDAGWDAALEQAAGKKVRTAVASRVNRPPVLAMAEYTCSMVVAV